MVPAGGGGSDGDGAVACGDTGMEPPRGGTSWVLAIVVGHYFDAAPRRNRPVRAFPPGSALW
jgi:hypothetical protein